MASSCWATATAASGDRQKTEGPAAHIARQAPSFRLYCCSENIVAVAGFIRQVERSNRIETVVRLLAARGFVGAFDAVAAESALKLYRAVVFVFCCRGESGLTHS